MKWWDDQRHAYHTRADVWMLDRERPGSVTIEAMIDADGSPSLRVSNHQAPHPTVWMGRLDMLMHLWGLNLSMSIGSPAGARLSFDEIRGQVDEVIATERAQHESGQAL